MRLRLIVFLATGLTAAWIQPGFISGQNAPDPEATLQYIHSSWDSLMRSTTDCDSLADRKSVV